MIEQRRYPRTPLNTPATFVIAGTAEERQGVGKDISIGGIFVETKMPAPFNTPIVIHAILPGANTRFALPGIVRWVSHGGMGVQFGMLGAVETHIITEIGRRATRP